MRKPALLLLAIGLALTARAAPAPLPSPTRAKADWKAMQGTWNVISYGSKGEFSSTRSEGARVVIAGDRLTYYWGGNVVHDWFIRLSAGPTSPNVDLTATRPELRRSYQGIYRLEGRSLTICHQGNSESARPSKIDGSGRHYLMVLERKKP